MKKVLFYVSTMFGFLAGNLSNAVLGQVNESDLLNNYYIGIAVPNGSKNDQLDALAYGNSHGYNTTGVLFSSYELTMTLSGTSPTGRHTIIPASRPAPTTSSMRCCGSTTSLLALA